jgi:hypothetical protein
VVRLSGFSQLDCFNERGVKEMEFDLVCQLFLFGGGITGILLMALGLNDTLLLGSRAKSAAVILGFVMCCLTWPILALISAAPAQGVRNLASLFIGSVSGGLFTLSALRFLQFRAHPKDVDARRDSAVYAFAGLVALLMFVLFIIVPSGVF